MEYCLHSKRYVKFLILFLSVTAALISVASAVLLIVAQELLLSPTAPGQQPTSGTLNLFTSFPVSIAPSGFDPLSVRSINATLDTSASVSSARVHFYKTSDLLIGIADLPLTSTYLAPVLYVRDPLNYYQADIPLYTAGGDSTIEYKVTASSALTYSDCPLEIFLFDDQTEYNRFKNGLNPDDSLGNYLKRSGCLNVQKENETISGQTVKFYLNNQSFYFVGVSIVNGVKVNFSMSGSVAEYDISDITADDCSLSMDHLSCNLNISDGIVTMPGTVRYILAQSTDLSTITYTVKSAVWNVWSVTSVSGFALSVFLLLMASALLLLVLCQKSRASKTWKYTKLSIQSYDCD